MNCERIQESLLEFESDCLPKADATAIREHLKGCPACQRSWADLQDTLLKLDRLPVENPSPQLRTQFYAMLDTHLQSSTPKSSRSPVAHRGLDRWLEAIWPSRPVWQFAVALVLLTGGVAIGLRLPSAEKSAQLSTAAQLAATQKEMAELRAQMESVNQLVAHSLAQQQPAHARLQQVVAGLGADSKNEHALAGLLSTLAFDPSTNIRLSALEALYANADQATVRQGVLAALPRETSPLVQVAMIDFLASVHDREALPTFQKIAGLPTADQAVRTAAQRAIALL